MEMRLSSAGFPSQPPEGERRVQNSELWHACAGPLVSLPAEGTRVVYFPQGHSEHVSVSTNKEVNCQIPNYPSLPPQLICHLHNLSMHADTETDEVYAQMTLQPLSAQEQKELYLPAELGSHSKQPTNYFCKTLTASDTSTHGGFSVPRRAAEKVFPPLDYSQLPPVQELIARDLHDNEWKFRHVFRGQPKRHLLTTGWSVFVSAKKLVAGDSILFIWNEKNQLLLGVRRANRPSKMTPSSVLSSDSMHLGLLAAAAHAASTNSPFTIIYNPRAGPSEFVIPLAKYIRAVYHTRVSIGMRFRMLFETEESSVRRYMGTITGISDLDPDLWPNSHWRSVKVGWDESALGERQARVSLWEIEPLTTFPMYPSSLPLGLKRPWPPALPSSFQGIVGGDSRMTSPPMWLRGDPSLDLQGISGMMPWGVHMHPRLDASSSSSSTMFGFQPDAYQAMALQDTRPMDPAKQAPTALQNTHTVNSSFMLQPLSFPSYPNPIQSLFDSFPQGGSWPPKQIPIEPESHEAAVSLPPFPDQERSVNHPHRHVFFGVETETEAEQPSSLLILNGVSGGFRTDGDSSSSALPPFGSCNFLGDAPPPPPPPSAVAEFSLNHEVMTPSSCMGESGFFYSQENAEEGQGSSPTRAFVKVCKSGFIGRSLDITKLSNYNDLRRELARMFGLQGLLEDPLRSGWQLVFVDRDDDVVLLGDGPWPDFVNSVSCIKILSPEEVSQRLSSGDTRQDSSSRSFCAGVPCVASLDY